MSDLFDRTQADGFVDPVDVARLRPVTERRDLVIQRIDPRIEIACCHKGLQRRADGVFVGAFQHRFGFEPGRSGRPMTLSQVGKLIGVTKERVRQIQNKALGKLRDAVEQRCISRADREQAGGFGYSAN